LDIRSSRLEAELLEEPTLALTLLVLVLEELAGLLEELGLGLWVGEGVGGEETLEVLGHGGLDTVAAKIEEMVRTSWMELEIIVVEIVVL